MASFVDAFFLLSFLFLLVVFFLKLYSLLSFAGWYDSRFVWLLFAASFLFYGFVLFTFLNDVSNGLFRVLFMVGNLLLPLIVIFTIAELFIILGRGSVVDSRRAQNSLASGDRGGRF